MRPEPPPEGWIVKPVPPTGGSDVSSTWSTSASGGASWVRRCSNAATAAGSPSTSTTTPDGVLDTCPVRPSSQAVT